MPSCTITSKGQVTLPKEIREYLHVSTGDRLDFVVDDDGKVVVRAARSRLDELRGMLFRAGRRPVSVAEMGPAVAREHGRRR
jgi:antitoxin PrlF